MARHLHFTDVSDTTCEVNLDLNQQEKRFEFLEVKIVKIINSRLFKISVIFFLESTLSERSKD